MPHHGAADAESRHADVQGALSTVRRTYIYSAKNRVKNGGIKRALNGRTWLRPTATSYESMQTATATRVSNY